MTVKVRGWPNGSIADTLRQTGNRAGKARRVHADRGSSATSKPVAFLMADLGITQDPQSPPCLQTTTAIFGKPLPDSCRNTGPDFPEQPALLAPRMPVPFPWSSSPGISDEHRPFRTGPLSPAVVHHGLAHRKPSSGGAPFSMPPTALILNASSASRPNRCPAPKEVWINKPQPTPENKTQ